MIQPVHRKITKYTPILNPLSFTIIYDKCINDRLRSQAPVVRPSPANMLRQSTTAPWWSSARSCWPAPRTGTRRESVFSCHEELPSPQTGSELVPFI